MSDNLMTSRITKALTDIAESLRILSGRATVKQLALEHKRESLISYIDELDDETREKLGKEIEEINKKILEEKEKLEGEE